MKVAEMKVGGKRADPKYDTPMLFIDQADRARASWNLNRNRTILDG